MEVGFAKGCRHIVFSGGEPTLKPDCLSALISNAYIIGYEKCTIQTNGYGFHLSSGKLCDFLFEMSKKLPISIAFSVHGYNAESHDKITRTKGSFVKIEYAIERMKHSRCMLLTNTVISTLNIDDLNKIAHYLMQYSPQSMQFSLIHSVETTHLRPSLDASLKAIKSLLPIVGKSILRTEGIPYCLLRSMEECVGESYWPNNLDVVNRNNKYIDNLNQIALKMRWRPENYCLSCLFKEICMGIWIEYRKDFETLKRFSSQYNDG